MEENRGVLLQCFHWYNNPDGKLWNQIKDRAFSLSEIGFTGVWLPPAYKGSSGGYDTGYGVYDMYDLGEFDQKNSIRTKYGTKDEYLEAIESLQRAGISAYADIVFNHRIGGDEREVMNATPYYTDNRLEPKGNLYEIESYTHFNFLGRNKKYSDFQWHWWHFDAIDSNFRNQEDKSTIYLFEGKTFDDFVSTEFGNYDYLMGCDLDFGSEEVRNELITWGKWYLDFTKVDGFRLDALKHIPSWFFPQWLSEMRSYKNKDLFTVGEFWDPNLSLLLSYIDFSSRCCSLFDVPLHYNFHSASNKSNNYDLRTIFDNTLVKVQPAYAVTFVSNHDSQALQALESVVEPWFKPIAYALILLRREGYPCVFYPDYYGAEYEDTGKDGNKHNVIMPSHKWLIDKFIYARKIGTFGTHTDYFDHANCIGWSFTGDDKHKDSMAVLISNGSNGSKSMNTGKANTEFTDITEHIKESVLTDSNGWGHFRCLSGSVSVWIGN